MTKKELATKIAEHMNRINNKVDVERQAEVMTRNMLKGELEMLVKRLNG